MKSKSLKIYLISGAVLLVLYIIVQANRPRSINWVDTLNRQDKIPFGTYIMFDRLTDMFPNSQIVTYRQPVYNVIAEDSVKNSSYIIIAPQIELTPTDYRQLVKYVEAGNDVFIGATYFGGQIKKNLNIETRQTLNLNHADSVHFLSPYLNPYKSYGLLKGVGNVFFNDFDTLKAVVAGENAEHKANFLKFNMGKGSLYLMANPNFFSNYSLLKTQGREYASTALSFVKKTDQVIWDDYYTMGDETNDSPMRVFLSHPSLAWAYYITLFSLLAFVFFEIKRRQRVIPVIEPLSNSTLDFVNVVGQVYYEKRSNTNIAHKKILYLLEHLREEYQVKTNKLDNEFIDRLTAKLNIDSQLAVDLVSFIQYINVQDTVTDRDLIELNNLIEKFYTKSR
jgi:hypothetical protein